MHNLHHKEQAKAGSAKPMLPVKIITGSFVLLCDDYLYDIAVFRAAIILLFFFYRGR